MNNEDIYAAAREEYRKVIVAQADKIASLSKRVEWFTHAIHTCHPECDRPLCKATREVERLRAALEEAIEYADQDYLTPAGEAMVNRWHALVKRESNEDWAPPPQHHAGWQARPFNRLDCARHIDNDVSDGGGGPSSRPCHDRQEPCSQAGEDFTSQGHRSKGARQ